MTPEEIRAETLANVKTINESIVALRLEFQNQMGHMNLGQNSIRESMHKIDTALARQDGQDLAGRLKTLEEQQRHTDKEFSFYKGGLKIIYLLWGVLAAVLVYWLTKGR